MKLVTFIQNDMAYSGGMLDESSVLNLNAGHTALRRSQGTDDTEKPFIASVKDLLEQGDVTLNIAEEIVQFAKEQQRQGTETDDYI
ncbi:MAG: hypothetical protein GY801_47730, partial [bacterium]|nr:hypothetical protein [bacterium]